MSCLRIYRGLSLATCSRRIPLDYNLRRLVTYLNLSNLKKNMLFVSIYWPSTQLLSHKSQLLLFVCLRTGPLIYQFYVDFLKCYSSFADVSFKENRCKPVVSRVLCDDCTILDKLIKLTMMNDKVADH